MYVREREREIKEMCERVISNIFLRYFLAVTDRVFPMRQKINTTEFWKKKLFTMEHERPLAY